MRVRDKNTDSEDPLELFRTLRLIDTVLLSGQYQFVNMSLGSDLPVQDTEVHA